MFEFHVLAAFGSALTKLEKPGQTKALAYLTCVSAAGNPK
jgi:hypothetical protein